jgi:hypothetical protein
MKSVLSTLIFTILAFLCALVAAMPVDLSKRDVFVPHVLEPRVGSVWKIGTTQKVTWDVTNPPKRITNTKAEIILVKDGLLDFEHPLATGLDVLAGQAEVVVPQVVPGDDYQILVFGDSGNTGQRFTITK